MKTKKKKTVVLLLVILVMLTFTGCKKERKSEDVLDWRYDKESESLIFENKSSKPIYASFDVVILNDVNEVIFKKNFKNQYISKDESISLNMKDIKPEYINPEWAKSMSVQNLLVEEYRSDIVLTVFSFIIVVFVTIGEILEYLEKCGIIEIS